MLNCLSEMIVTNAQNNRSFGKTRKDLVKRRSLSKVTASNDVTVKALDDALLRAPSATRENLAFSRKQRLPGR
jgi:hypothetical protein